jgi:hypothetical protein
MDAGETRSSVSFAAKLNAIPASQQTRLSFGDRHEKCISATKLWKSTAAGLR